jgi:periplasmic divalent cation tolerance protein
MIEPLMILTTVGNAEQGRRIARELVEGRLAACVSCVPQVISFYRWSGRVEEDAETLLVIKTTGERLEDLKNHLLRVHPYEVPEFLVLPIRDGGEQYIRWLGESTGRSSEAGKSGPE